MRTKTWAELQESSFQAEATELQVYTDPFSYFADVIRGKIKLDQYSLYSLSNNMIVAEILDAARSSAATRKTVFLLP
jgi:hypothetical protein